MTGYSPESALRQVIGDSRIVHDQLHHLAEVALGPKSSTGLAVQHTDLRYGPGSTEADYPDNPDTVREYTRLWSRLQAAASGQVESRNLIVRIADELKAGL